MPPLASLGNMPRPPGEGGHWLGVSGSAVSCGSFLCVKRRIVAARSSSRIGLHAAMTSDRSTADRQPIKRPLEIAGRHSR
jgi:hypothetical protein